VQPAGRSAPAPARSPLPLGAPDPDWDDQIAALRAYVDEHGKLPGTATGTPLARWWFRQIFPVNRRRLPAEHEADVVALIELARERRQSLINAAALERRKARAAVVHPVVRTTLSQARFMLDSPYLLPGDREVLALRVEHPGATLRELARMAGKSTAAYSAQLRRAMWRNERSARGRT
jgi:hypothetical protein